LKSISILEDSNAAMRSESELSWVEISLVLDKVLVWVVGFLSAKN